MTHTHTQMYHIHTHTHIHTYVEQKVSTAEQIIHVEEIDMVTREVHEGTGFESQGGESR